MSPRTEGEMTGASAAAGERRKKGRQTNNADCEHEEPHAREDPVSVKQHRQEISVQLCP